jgi:glycosyltransferase involved in cell wall biosynthesis
MKVAIIGSRGYPYVYSGYETFVKELSERLVLKNIEVKVYCHKNLFATHPKFVKGIELVYIPTIETKSLSQLIHSFFSMFHACFTKTDVILVVNAGNGPFGFIARIFNKPTLINVDGLDWLRPKWKGLGARYFYFAAKMATKLYDIIITDAEEMRNVYLKEFKKDSSVIAYGDKPNYSKNITLLSQFNLNPLGYYLIVGRLIPDNNADIIIDGFIKSNSSKKLVIVGDVPYKDHYAETLKTKANDNILFLGYITDSEVLSELYCNCYVYVHGHEFGGTNPTMLKAMASGCAIFALQTPFNREMLAHGDYGLFFEKNSTSVSDLIHKIEQSEEKLDILRKNSRNGITEKYNWDYITESYISIMHKLLKKD